MSETFPLPAELIARAEEFYESGEAPVPVRVAATVVLLRDNPFEVYVLRRAATMAFASGMYAFPGGSVDPRDAHALTEWHGPSDVEWGRRLGVPPDAARAVVCAAVREVFEESGVLLAPVPDTSGPEWEGARQALVSNEVSLSEVFAARGLGLRSDLLWPWTRWITPEFEPRRFDTYFFVAVVPDGQQARDVSGEADHTMWARPADLLADPEALMLPPTTVMLRDLAEHSDVPSMLAAAAHRHAATPVVPWLAGDRLVIP